MMDYPYRYTLRPRERSAFGLGWELARRQRLIDLDKLQLSPQRRDWCVTGYLEMTDFRLRIHKQEDSCCGR